MSTDREYDIWKLEAEIANEKLETEWRKEKMGKRAQRVIDAGKEEKYPNPEGVETGNANGY